MGHFYFVRHGQTVWNVENKICGATDIALTEKGHQQAIETGHEILCQGIQADEILYSPLMRAADTAKHISEITGIPARVEPRLIEQNFGKYESTVRNGEEFPESKAAVHYQIRRWRIHAASGTEDLQSPRRDQSRIRSQNLYPRGTQRDFQGDPVLFLRDDKRRIRDIRSEKLRSQKI